MVREEFGVEPDPWQLRLLESFADPEQFRIAMKACKGPGKTAGLAWCIWNFLLCYGEAGEHPKGAATAISVDNLDDNLWTELAKWQQRSAILKRTFEWTKTRIFAKDHPETWFFSKRAWAKSADKQQQANTLAGLHAKYLLFVIDESGGVPDAVMAAAEGGLANVAPGHFVKILQGGNPTHLDGPLYRACTQERHLWTVIEITGDPDDPGRSPRISQRWAREQIQKYGRDNPWVLVNVFGRFPPSSLNALLGPDEVRAAMKRTLNEADARRNERMPVVLGVDVARFGDDVSVIFPRQGQVARKPTPHRNVDSLQGATLVMLAEDEHGSALTFVDATGGWGGGWIDQLKHKGRNPAAVEYAGKPNDPRFANKRTEMWWELAQWVKSGGCLPDVPELVAELSTPTYYFRGDKIQLEDKDEIKERLGRSPNYGDALAQTFAEPVEGGRLFGAPWQFWKGKPPPCEAIVMSAAPRVDERGVAWCLTVWGVFTPQDGKASALALEVRSGQGSLPEFTEAARKLWRDAKPDYMLLPRTPDMDPVARHLRTQASIVVKRFRYDEDSGPQAAGDVLRAGRAWMPEREWAKRLMADLRRYPYGDTAIVAHSVSLTLLWLRQIGGVDTRPATTPEDEEAEALELQSKRRRRRASPYG